MYIRTNVYYLPQCIICYRVNQRSSICSYLLTSKAYVSYIMQQYIISNSLIIVPPLVYRMFGEYLLQSRQQTLQEGSIMVGLPKNREDVYYIHQ